MNFWVAYLPCKPWSLNALLFTALSILFWGTSACLTCMITVPCAQGQGICLLALLGLFSYSLLFQLSRWFGILASVASFTHPESPDTWDETASILRADPGSRCLVGGLWGYGWNRTVTPHNLRSFILITFTLIVALLVLPVMVRAYPWFGLEYCFYLTAFISLLGYTLYSLCTSVAWGSTFTDGVLGLLWLTLMVCYAAFIFPTGINLPIFY